MNNSFTIPGPLPIMVQPEKGGVVQDERRLNNMSYTIAEFNFYTIKDVSTLLGVSHSTAQRLVKQLNEENEKDGYLVIPGKIGKRFFESKVRM